MILIRMNSKVYWVALQQQEGRLAFSRSRHQYRRVDSLLQTARRRKRINDNRERQVRQKREVLRAKNWRKWSRKDKAPRSLSPPLLSGADGVWSSLVGEMVNGRIHEWVLEITFTNSAYLTKRDCQKEVSLPHQIRSLAFPLPQSLFLGFSTSQYGTIVLPYISNPSSNAPLILSELFTPNIPSNTVSASTTSSSAAGSTGSHLGTIPGLGGLGGLAAKTGGYMGLGSKVERNTVVKVKEGEVLVQRDNTGVFLDSKGKSSRQNGIDYGFQTDESITSWPYLLSISPAPAAVENLSRQQAQNPITALPTVQVYSIPTLSYIQAILVPPLYDGIPAGRPVSVIDIPPLPVTQSARLLTASYKGKAPLAVVTQPLSDLSSSTSSSTRNTTASIYLLTLSPWAQQLDSLVSQGLYEEALSLLSSLENPDHVLPDAIGQMKKLRVLAGLSLFLNKQFYNKAIDIFIEENVTPAKVVALFPKAISGKLFCERDDIEQIWGGRLRTEIYPDQENDKDVNTRKQNKRQSTVDTMTSIDSQDNVYQNTGQTSTATSSERSSWRFSPAKKKEEDAGSSKSGTGKKSNSAVIASKEARDGSYNAAVTIDREAEDGECQNSEPL